MPRNLATLGVGGAGGIQLVGWKVTHHGNGTTSVSLTDLSGLISAPQENDLVVVASVCVTSISGDLDMTCSGFTEVADLYANDTVDANLGVFLKRMTSSPDTTITLNDPPSGNIMSVAIMVFRGVNSTPQDVTATTATGTNSVLANPPSITPATIGAVVVAIGGGAHQAGDVDFASSDLNGFITDSGNDVNESTIGMGWSGPWVSGAVNPAAFTFGAADNGQYSWAACCLALRPA